MNCFGFTYTDEMRNTFGAEPISPTHAARAQCIRRLSVRAGSTRNRNGRAVMPCDSLPQFKVCQAVRNIPHVLFVSGSHCLVSKKGIIVEF
jgi:hypothetical protein